MSNSKDTLFQNAGGGGGTGTGTGVLNLINKGDAETGDISGWSMGKISSLTGMFPAVGATIGAAGGTCWSATATDKLAGNYSYKFTPVSSSAGECAYTTVTIDQGYRATVLELTGLVKYSGAFATADQELAVAFLVVDGASAGQWVQSAPFKFAYQSVAGPMQPMEVQLPSDCTSARIVIYQTVATVSSWTYAMLDSLSFSLRAKSIGTPATSAVAYTPTFTGFGTVTNVNIYSQRIADYLRVFGFFQAGTTTATEAQMTIGFNGANGNVTTSVPNGAVLGVANDPTASTTNFGAAVIAAATNQNYVRFSRQTSTTNEATAVNGNAFPSSGFINVNFCVKIYGWESGTVMSSDAATGVVVARYTTNAGQTVAGSETRINFEDLDYDPSGLVTTGAGTWAFTAKVPGYYRCSGRLTLTGAPEDSDFSAKVYYNAVLKEQAYRYDQRTGLTQVATVQWATTGQLLAGQTIYINSINVAGTALSTNAYENWIAIERVDGPTQIAASEKIFARYTSASTSINSSSAIIQNNTKEEDTHGAVTTGASWKFTAPRADIYTITCAASFTSNTHAANAIQSLIFNKNGSGLYNMDKRFWRSITEAVYCQGTITQRLNAGDYISVSGFSTTTTTLDGSTNNYIEISSGI